MQQYNYLIYIFSITYISIAMGIKTAIDIENTKTESLCNFTIIILTVIIMVKTTNIIIHSKKHKKNDYNTKR